MAFSATLKRKSLMGNMRVEVWELDFASVTTGTFSAGLGTIDHVSFNNETTEAQGLVTKSGSEITVSGVTSSDVGTIIVFGL